MNFGKSSSNFFRGRTMKNLFNSKSSYKFTSSTFNTKNTINFSNSYFLFTLRNLMNVSQSISSFQISKMVLGSAKNIGEDQDEISISTTETTGNAVNSINEFAMILKSKIFLIIYIRKCMAFYDECIGCLSGNCAYWDLGVSV